MSNEMRYPADQHHGRWGPPGVAPPVRGPNGPNGPHGPNGPNVGRERSVNVSDFGRYGSRGRRPPMLKPNGAMRSAPLPNAVDQVPTGRATPVRTHYPEPKINPYRSRSTTPQYEPPPMSPRWDSLAHNNFSHNRPPGAAPRAPTPLSSTTTTATSSPGILSPIEDQAESLDALASEKRDEFPPPSPMAMHHLNRDATPSYENFSRPRLASIKQPQSQPQPQQQPQRAANTSSTQSDPTQPETQAQQLLARERGQSVSSNNSTSTFISLPVRLTPELYPRDSVRSRSRQGTRSGSRPPPAYHNNESNGAYSGGYLHHMTSMPTEELRSSYRSQLSTSTAQGTLTTERSSIMTKSSSITSMYGGPVDDDFDVDDVMGIYEKGFRDSPAPSDREDEDSRPPTPNAEVERRQTLMLEAMTGPSIARPVRNSHIDHNRIVSVQENASVVADPPAVVRRSAHLSVSLPKHFGEQLELGPKHDSGKLVGDTTGSEHEDEESPSQPQQSPSPEESSQKTQHEEVPNNVSDQEAQKDTSKNETPQMEVRQEDASQKETPQKETAQRPAPRVVIPPAPAIDPSMCDRYGFKKQNQYVTEQQYDTWNVVYTDYLDRRRAKWIAYLRENGLMTDRPNRFPPRSAKTKRFVRKGIPPDWRGAAWFYYAGGPAVLAKHGGVYDDLLRREVKDVDVEAIERDLHRTFPDNIKFQSGNPAAPRNSRSDEESDGPDIQNSQRVVQEGESPMISALRRILHAFSIYNPRIGYCQSLNFLAGLLLLFTETEEHAFWLLNIITRVYLPGTHEMSLEGANVDLGVLMSSLRDAMPNVWVKIAGDLDGTDSIKPRSRFHRRGVQSVGRLPPVTLCMTAWFMSCYIGTLPIETTLRVWDVFFYEGSKTLFRIALAIFKLGENEIRNVKDPMEIFQTVQTIPRRMLDANGLIDACFRRRNGFGHISQETIEERRQERRDGLLTKTKGGGTVKDDTASEVRRKGTLFRKKRRPAEA